MVEAKGLTHHSEKTPIDLLVKRSKAKVTGKDFLQICSRIITTVRINKLL